MFWCSENFSSFHVAILILFANCRPLLSVTKCPASLRISRSDSVPPSSNSLVPPLTIPTWEPPDHNIIRNTKHTVPISQKEGMI